MELDPDSVDDDFLLPPAPPVRALGKFRPKAHPKPVKSVQTPSKPQTVKSVQTPSKSLVASLSEELPVRVPNTESAGENSILGIASVSEERMIERISVERAQVSDSDASVCVHSDKIEAEAMIYSPGLESVDEGVFQSCATSGAMDLDPDSVDEDFLLPPAAPVRALGKFRPKAHPKAGKSVQAPSKPPIAPPRMEPLVHVTDSESAGENLSLPIAPVSQERMGQEGIYVERAQVYDNDLSLCVHSDKIEAVAMTSSPGLESVGDGVFQSRATSGSMDLDPDSVPEDFRILSAAPVRALGKFRPKAHPKTVKSVQAPAKPPVAPPSAEPPVHVPNQESAGENSSLRIAPVSEERMTEERISAERTPVSDNDASLCIHLDKIEAEGMASCSGLESERDTAGTMDLDTDSVSDDLLLPPAPAVRALGKFRPKAHPKTVKSVQTPSKPPVANQLVHPVMEPPRRVSDLTSPDKKSSLRIASFSEERMTQEGISVERAQASDSDANLFVHLDKAEAEALASSPGMESADDGFFQSSVTSGAMDLDTDSVPDDLLLPPARAVRALGKFCPKAHPKTVKLVQAPSKPPVADQLVPPVMEPAGHVSDPTIPDKKLSLLIASFSEERMTEEGISVERAQASDSDACLCVHRDKTETEAMASSPGMESADDDIFHSRATSGRAVGRFKPKTKLESKEDKLSITYVADPGAIMSDITQGHSISSFDPEVLPPEHQFSPEPFCHDEERLTQEGISPERAQLFDSDTHSHIRPENLEADVVASSTCLESVDDGLFKSHATSDSAAEDILLQPSPASVRPLGKFRPKAHPKSNKSVQAPSKPFVATQVAPITEPLVLVSGPKSTDEKSSLPNAFINDCLVDASGFDSTQGSVCHIQPDAFPSVPFVSGVKEESSQRDQGGTAEAMDLYVDTVAEDFFLQSVPAVKEAARFRPKLVPRPKEKKIKRVSFNISDSVETVHPLDNSFAQSEVTEKLACSATEVEPSFLEMLCEGSLDETPDSAFVVSDCNGDVGMGHMDIREEDSTEIAGLESPEKISSQSTPKIRKFLPKHSSRVKNVKPNAPVATHGVLECIYSESDSPPLESEPLEGHASIVPPDSQFNSVTTGDSTLADLILDQANHVDTCASSEYNHVVGRETSLELSKDISKEDQSHDADVTGQIFNEKSTSTVVEDGASKSSRKSRKRVSKRTPVDKVHEDRDFDNSNIREVEEARNDDEYRGEDAPKPKRGRKKMTKPVTVNEKPTRKRIKASEEPKSAEQEPKKKFPHSTRRNRRQVNKELLLLPDDEIDRRRLSIKDLIRTYEAKERISSKESAAWANSSSNQSHKSFLDDTHHDTDNGIRQSWDSYGDEENDDVQLNDTTVKWNHHSFRKKPSSTSRWSKSETELFYQALRQFGTNFEMIQKLFPGRTRHQMTLKFKNERRKFPLQVADATTHPSTDFSLVKLVMQKLAEEEKDKAKEKVFYVQDEDENGQTEKEEQVGNDWEGGLDSSVKADDYEGVGAAPSPNQLNEYEDNLEWDANSSYFRDGEKNEYDGFY